MIDIRNYGLLGAIEIKADKNNIGTLGPKALEMCWERGVMVRGIGDSIVISPPLTINKPEIDEITSVIRDVIPLL